MEFIVEIYYRGKKIIEPAPYGTQIAEIYPASDIQGSKEVILFKNRNGQLTGIYIPPRDSAYFIKVGYDKNGNWIDITPPLPPGKRWVKLYESNGSVKGKIGDIPRPPFTKDKKLVLDIDVGNGKIIRKEFPPGTVRVLLSKAIKLPPSPNGNAPLIALPPSAQSIDVWTSDGITVIPFFDKNGNEIGKAEIAGVTLNKDQISIVEAAVGIDISGKPIETLEIHDISKSRLKVINITPNGPLDVTPQPPPGHIWGEITILPDGGITLKDIPLDT